MPHQALLLEPEETLYVGVMSADGEYHEVRLAHKQDGLLVTDEQGSYIAGQRHG